MFLYNGARQEEKPYKGICFTDEHEIAEQYSTEHLHETEIDFSGLNIVEVEGYDRDEDYSVGDHDADLERLSEEGVDVITFDDESPNGEPHRTWRFISEKSITRINY